MLGSVNLTMSGCSAPYREAVEQRLRERNLLDNADTEQVNVALVSCDQEPSWDELSSACTDPSIVAVAILSSLTVDDYVRALAHGADGVVYVDTSSAITADVIKAAIQGEVLLPRQAAESLALLARRTKPSTKLGDAEIKLLREIASGKTLVELAKETFFSERTVRRHLQNLYLKLGVQNRAEAIAAAAKMGITD